MLYPFPPVTQEAEKSDENALTLKDITDYNTKLNGTSARLHSTLTASFQTRTDISMPIMPKWTVFTYGKT